MNVTSCEKKDNKIAELTVVVTAEEFDKAVEASYKKNRNQISVPGFRKGKAPRKIIENMYGASVFYNDALDIVLPSVCAHGISENNLRTVGYPKIADVKVEDDKSLTVNYSVDLYPEATIAQYMGLEAVKKPAVVEDSAVDSEIASVQLRNARIQTADRPAINGDTVIIDFEGFVDGKAFDGGKGEDYELVLGSNTFIPGFEAKLGGMTVGEERDLDLVFPEDYQKDLAGKPVVFKVKLKEVKEKILPELDDEFAKDVSEFDTLEAYKNSVREKLTADRQAEADKAFEDAVLEKLAENVETEVPDAMIDDFLDNQLQNMASQLSAYGMDIKMYLQMMGTDEAGFREKMRPSALRQIRITLALEKVAEIEELEPTEEEIEAYYADAAKKYSVDVEEAKANLAKEGVVRELKLRAASKLVTEKAVAVEAPAEPEKEEAEEEASPAKEKKSKSAKSADKAADAEEKPAAEKKTAKKKKTADASIDE